MAVRLWLYSRWYKQLGEMFPYSAEYSAEIGGDNRLDLELDQPLSKGDRFLWEMNGIWHEHVVESEEQTHDGNETFNASCVWSLQWDLSGSHIRQWTVNQAPADTVLAHLLEQTLWEVGKVDVDVETADFEFEKESVYDALTEVAEAYEAEIHENISVERGRVTHRAIDLVKTYGRDRGVRFDYGFDLQNVTKEITDTDVITAMYGYGKQLEKSEDASEDAPTEYLWCLAMDDGALEQWGMPDGHGGKRHRYGFFEDSDIEDMEELKRRTGEELAKVSEPTVNYTTSMPFASLKSVDLGDTVHVVDRDFTPELRVKARVSSITVDLVTRETTQCTFGTSDSVVPDVLSRAWQESKRAVAAASSVDAAALTDHVNEYITANGTTAKEVTLKDGDVKGTLSISDTGSLLWNGKAVTVA